MSRQCRRDIWYCCEFKIWSVFCLSLSLQWRHNGHDSISNHQPHDCLLNRLYRHRSKKTSKLRVTGLCAGNSPVSSPHKWPVTRKMFQFDDVIMIAVSFNSSPPSATYMRWWTVVSIGSGNGLSPVRCQAIPWTYAALLWIGPLGTNFSELWIEIKAFQ